MGSGDTPENASGVCVAGPGRLRGCLAGRWVQPPSGPGCIRASLCFLQVASQFGKRRRRLSARSRHGERVGPVRVTQSGLIAPGRLVAATAAVLLLAIVPGLYLVWLGGAPLAIIGLLALRQRRRVHGRPLAIGVPGAWRGLCLSLLRPGGCRRDRVRHDPRGDTSRLVASIPMGCLISAILVVNNLRDMDTDRAAGKRTIAVRIGVKATRWEYAALGRARLSRPRGNGHRGIER